VLKSKTALTDVLSTSEDSWETKKLKRIIEHLYLDEDGTMMARIPIRGRRREVVVCMSWEVG
jgi:hypothetical protein